MRTTLDASAQRTALDGLAGRAGSIVALEPAHRAHPRDGQRAGIRPQRHAPRHYATTKGSPILNRATQGRYPPGSTFKVVTAAAALDSGRYEPWTIVDGSSPKVVSGTPLANFGGPQSYGPITLTDALTNSVNTVWAEVGVELGGRTMAEYMERFGFGDLPPLEYPRADDAERNFCGPPLISASRRSVDLGRLAIGQERLQVTPLQMAMVAAAVGNEDAHARMAPRLVERVTDAEGRVVDRGSVDELSEVMSPKAAAQLTRMVSAQVVEEGSGTAAALKAFAWPARRAPLRSTAAPRTKRVDRLRAVERPRMAVAVTIEDSARARAAQWRRRWPSACWRT